KIYQIKNINEYDIKKNRNIKLKTNFLNGDSKIKKDMFFNKFHFLNNNLQDIDYTFKIDKTSKELLHKLNVKKIIEKRRQNALVLYRYLKDFQLIKPLIENINLEHMTPLFIPIIVKEPYKRNELVKYLINEQIYCPVHW